MSEHSLSCAFVVLSGVSSFKCLWNICLLQAALFLCVVVLESREGKLFLQEGRGVSFSVGSSSWNTSQKADLCQPKADVSCKLIPFAPHNFDVRGLPLISQLNNFYTPTLKYKWSLCYRCFKLTCVVFYFQFWGDRKRRPRPERGTNASGNGRGIPRRLVLLNFLQRKCVTVVV